MNIYVFLTRVCLRAVLCINLLVSVHFHAVWSVVHDRRDRQDTSAADTHRLAPATAKQVRWAESAWHYLQTMDCSRSMFISERDCDTLPSLNRSQTNVYLADPLPFERYKIVVPDDNLATDDAHSAVLVIDPFPAADFGHLVVVFYIDLNIKKDWCAQDNGVSLGECSHFFSGWS